jgi:hypothetical protein
MRRRVKNSGLNVEHFSTWSWPYLICNIAHIRKPTDGPRDRRNVPSLSANSNEKSCSGRFESPLSISGGHRVVTAGKI